MAKIKNRELGCFIVIRNANRGEISLQVWREIQLPMCLVRASSKNHLNTIQIFIEQKQLKILILCKKTAIR